MADVKLTIKKQVKAWLQEFRSKHYKTTTELERKFEQTMEFKKLKREELHFETQARLISEKIDRLKEGYVENNWPNNLPQSIGELTSKVNGLIVDLGVAETNVEMKVIIAKLRNLGWKTSKDVF